MEKIKIQHIDHMKERKIDILQFVEKDISDVMQDKEFETDGYRRKRETVKCTVTVEKTNKYPCRREFTAYIYVFAEKYNADVHGLISCSTAEFSFKNGSKVFGMKTSPASVEYVKSAYMDKKGFRYEGYIAVVEDDAGNVVTMKSTRKLYEDNWGKIRGASAGTTFDGDFDVIDGVRYDAWQ